jgi:N-acetylglucosaminyl-diphospho-decaprenol L-rhamnosyltransferase
MDRERSRRDPSATGERVLDTAEGDDLRAAIAAVLVNHNSGDRLPALLDALEPDVDRVFVVDNASSDGSLAHVEGRPKVVLIHNAVNRGFAAAANQGAALAETEWLLFVNPDTHFDTTSPQRLVANVPVDVAVVAALQLDEYGRPRSETAGYEASIRRYLVWALIPTRFHRSYGPWLAPPFPLADSTVDWASGAFVAVRRSVFRELGGFDERFFLYHEDVDFGRRVRRRGFRIIVRPSVRVHHEVGHGSATVRVAAGLRAIESLAKYFSGWSLRGLGLVLGLGHCLRLVLGRGATRYKARAVLPYCWLLICGRRPTGPHSQRG